MNCIANFVPVEKAQIAGNPALILPTGGTLQAYHELLVYTPKDQAEPAALRIKSGAALEPGLQATLDGNPDAAAIAYARGANSLGLKWGTLALSQPGGGFELKAVGLAESPEAAARVAGDLTRGIAQAKSELSNQSDSPELAQVLAMLDEVKVEQQGASVSAKLTLDKARAESFFSGVLVALAKEGAGRYAAAAKTAEARDNVMRIALGLSDYARAHKPPKRPFPASAPLSPGILPGKRPQDASGSFAHPSWTAIAFKPEGPVYYSYEFVTAQDGRSVEVIARGDLDGDGKQSKFAVRVSVEAGEPKIAPELMRDNPYE
jgi:hypothetical protein